MIIDINDFEPILLQVKVGDPVGAAYRFAQLAGAGAEGRMFYEAGSIALARREELGDNALRFARLVFAEAVERDPEFGEAHHDLATTMRELGMAEDAIRHYRRALDLLPGDPDCLIGLGAAQCDAGKLDESVASLKSACERHPENGQAFANLAIALEAQGEEDPAVAAYAKAVARFDAALAEAEDDEAATEAAVRRRWTRIQLAELLERLERWPQAVLEFRRLYEEEQAIAEAEEEARKAEEQESDEDEPAKEQRTETLEEPAPEALTDDDAPKAGATSDDADEGEEDGRVGLERLFVRLVQLGRADLGLLVLDDLGGEVSDSKTQATYTIYDSGEGSVAIMVEHWDDGGRERIEPIFGKPRKLARRRTANAQKNRKR